MCVVCVCMHVCVYVYMCVIFVVDLRTELFVASAMTFAASRSSKRATRWLMRLMSAGCIVKASALATFHPMGVVEATKVRDPNDPSVTLEKLLAFAAMSLDCIRIVKWKLHRDTHKHHFYEIVTADLIASNTHRKSTVKC
jgi:hypothetical protein